MIDPIGVWDGLGDYLAARYSDTSDTNWPTSDELAKRLALVRLMWWVYNDPNTTSAEMEAIVGGPNDEPRKTWDAGGTESEGYAAIDWGD